MENSIKDFDYTYWVTGFSTDEMGDNYFLMKIDPSLMSDDQVVENYNFMYESDREKFVIENNISLFEHTSEIEAEIDLSDFRIIY